MPCRVQPGFHMIVRIVSIVPVVSKNVQAIGTIIWKHFPDDRRRSQTTRTIGTITIVRIELCSIRTIAHDRGDREKSEAIKWKHSQTIGTIGTIEVYPRKHHSRHHFSRFSVVGPRNFADDRELPLFWTIEAIIWKPAIAPIVPIVSIVSKIF